MSMWKNSSSSTQPHLQTGTQQLRKKDPKSNEIVNLQFILWSHDCACPLIRFLCMNNIHFPHIHYYFIKNICVSNFFFVPIQMCEISQKFMKLFYQMINHKEKQLQIIHKLYRIFWLFIHPINYYWIYLIEYMNKQKHTDNVIK